MKNQQDLSTLSLKKLKQHRSAVVRKRQSFEPHLADPGKSLTLVSVEGHTNKVKDINVYLREIDDEIANRQ